MRPVLELHLSGQSSPEIHAALSSHVPTCDECLSVVGAYAGAGEPAAPPDPGYAPGPVQEAAYLSEAELMAEIQRLSHQMGAPGSLPPPGPVAAGSHVPPASPRSYAPSTLAPPAPTAIGHPPGSAPDPDASLVPRPVRALFELLLFGSLAAVVGIATIVAPDFFSGPEQASTGRIASGVRLAEVRFTRLRPDGARERMDGFVIAPQDRIGFSYVNTADWERLLIVVTDEKNNIYWQFPEWTDRRAPAYAPTILSNRRVHEVPPATHLEWEGKLLTVRSIFAKDFITTRQVEEKLLDPERDPASQLFPGTLERIQMVVVDPAATEVHGLPQDETSDPGTAPQDNYLRVEPEH